MAKFIDSEKLVNIFNAKGDMATGTPKAVFYNAAKIVEALPAADVVEVKHGYWEVNTSRKICEPEAICSVCGRSVVYNVVNDVWEFENFCPHCGAKMDGG